MTRKNEHGYVYVKNWEQRQHHKYDSPPWHKVYNELLRNDDYLRLSHADRGLLHDLWTLASLSGDGRVSADRTLLARQLNVRRVSLEPLINAGFIKVLGTKRVRSRTESVLQSKSREEPLTPQSGDGSLRAKGLNPRALGTNPRAADAANGRVGKIAGCRRFYNELVAEGYPAEGIPDVLEREYRRDLSIVDEAVPGWRAA